MESNATDAGNGGGAGESAGEKPTERARWIAAASYIGPASLVSLYKTNTHAFIRYHASQGFLLFVAECAAIGLVIVLDMALGKTRIVGLIVLGLVQFVLGTAFLALSVIGFVKALFGDYWSLPFLGAYRHRVPGLHGRNASFLLTGFGD